MKLQLKINHKRWVADGDGVALTVFKDQQATLVSLAATVIEKNGDLVSTRWVDGLRLKVKDELSVSLVGDEVPATRPVKKTVETARTRERKKRQYVEQEMRKLGKK